MKSQIIFAQISPKVKRSQPFQSPQKQALKAKSYIFSRTRSMKLQKDVNKIIQLNRPTQSDEKIFVPKLKSKQLLREPKFFFSLQRKKIKHQNSEPSFDEIKVQNPEMKGSKAKALYTKLLLTRKQSFKQSQSPQRVSMNRNYSFNERLPSCESQASNFREIFNNENISRKFSGTEPNQTADEMRSTKRPNMYENISFLIRRKREIKNKNTLSRINHSKHYMTEGVRMTGQEEK